jgi:hypothetical protein
MKKKSIHQTLYKFTLYYTIFTFATVSSFLTLSQAMRIYLQWYLFKKSGIIVSIPVGHVIKFHEAQRAL